MTRNRALILITLLIALCVAGSIGAYVLRPPVFFSHSEVIVYMLSRRGMAVERINATLPWPDGVNYYAYGSSVYPYNLNVDLQLRDGRKADGRVECKRDRYDCRLTLATLGIDLVPMPNISDGTTPWVPKWLNDLATRLDPHP
jgi:hypothetical protein